MANLQAMADAGAIPCVLVTGMTFVILMGSIDLSVEGVMASSSCLLALLLKNDRTTLDLGWIGVLATVAVGALFGLANGLISTRLRVPSFMTTLGMWFVGLGIAAVLFGSQAVVISDWNFRAIELTRWAGFSVESFIGLAAIALGVFLERYTRFGRYALAIGGDEGAARTAGIRVDRYRTLVLVFAGAMSAFAGVMILAKLGMGDSLAGSGDLFATITAVVVGGTLLMGGSGGILRSFVGVLIIVVLADGMVQVGVDPEAQEAVQGLLIVCAVALTQWPLRQRLAVVK
jgi:ribose transport system permease protein